MACNLDCIFWGKQTKLTWATWVIFLGKWKNIKKWSVPFGFSIKNVVNLKKVSLVYLYIFTLHLQSTATLESAFVASFKTHARFIDFIYGNNESKRNKRSWKKVWLPTNFIVLPWSVYAEPSAKRGRLKTQPEERQWQN